MAGTLFETREQFFQIFARPIIYGLTNSETPRGGQRGPFGQPKATFEKEIFFGFWP
jgi:hypothetical protein